MRLNWNHVVSNLNSIVRDAVDSGAMTNATL